jgi:hypothetical protein
MCDQPQRPASDHDREAWKAYWKLLGMSWRTEPEIAASRQRYLAERRAIKPDIEGGVYPFRDEHGSITLARVDVEWLLATHESGGVIGPVSFEDAREHKRARLDLRGADLRGEDLSRLPLTGIIGGLTLPYELEATRKQRHMASLHLEGADLVAAHLEFAILVRARLSKTNLQDAHLECANMLAIHLEGATPHRAFLQGANRPRAYLDPGLHLEGATLCDKQCGSIVLVDVRWNGSNLAHVDWSQLDMVTCSPSLQGRGCSVRPRRPPHESPKGLPGPLALLWQRRGPKSTPEETARQRRAQGLAGGPPGVHPPP